MKNSLTFQCGIVCLMFGLIMLGSLIVGPTVDSVWGLAIIVTLVIGLGIVLCYNGIKEAYKPLSYPFTTDIIGFTEIDGVKVFLRVANVIISKVGTNCRGLIYISRYKQEGWEECVRRDRGGFTGATDGYRTEKGLEFRICPEEYKKRHIGKRFWFKIEKLDSYVDK